MREQLALEGRAISLQAVSMLIKRRKDKQVMRIYRDRLIARRDPAFEALVSDIDNLLNKTAAL